MSWLWTDSASEINPSSQIVWKPRTVAAILLLLVTIDTVLLMLFLFSIGVRLV